MNLNKNQKKQFANLLTAYANSSLKDGEIISDYESKAFKNLFLTLSKLKEIEDIYDGDILLYAVEEEILKRKERTPVKIHQEEIEQIIDDVIDVLKKNIAEHLIVIPIANAQFSNIMKTGNLTFIPRNFERIEKIKILSKLSKKKLQATIIDLEHTEKL